MSQARNEPNCDCPCAQMEVWREEKNKQIETGWTLKRSWNSRKMNKKGVEKEGITVTQTNERLVGEVAKSGH